MIKMDHGCSLNSSSHSTAIQYVLREVTEWQLDGYKTPFPYRLTKVIATVTFSNIVKLTYLKLELS